MATMLALLLLAAAAVGSLTFALQGRLAPEQVRIEDGSILTAEDGRYPVAAHFGGRLETFYGRIDRRDETRVHLYFRGWAADPASGKKARWVVLFLDGKPVATGRTGQHRPVVGQGIDRSLVRSGFEIETTIDYRQAAAAREITGYALLEDGRAAALLYGDPQQLFENSTDVCLRASAENEFLDFQPLYQVSLDPDGKDLRILASGSDPQIALPALDLALNAPVVVCVDLSVSAPTWVQIYYSRHSSEIYSEALSQTRPVAAGRSKVHFMFWAYDLHGRLRFDPGRHAGPYRLHRVEIRRLHPPSPAPPGFRPSAGAPSS